jgi:hypothetical protein
VELTSWAVREDGTIVVDLNVKGPVRSPLKILTVEIRRLGLDGSTLSSDWVTIDLSQMVRGSGFQKTVMLPAGGQEPAGLGLLLHPVPASEILPKLRELQENP